ncbi:HNH endonuclease [Streptomyces thermodiastaticus]|nr:HNH endonuclease signature motif containing protein [Streptomyces thermodiastaticus]
MTESGRCPNHATEVDHIRPGDDHSMSNLRAICSPCHKAKSSREGGQALARKRREIEQRFRRTEKHPGEL